MLFCARLRHGYVCHKVPFKNLLLSFRSFFRRMWRTTINLLLISARLRRSFAYHWETIFCKKFSPIPSLKNLMTAWKPSVFAQWRCKDAAPTMQTPVLIASLVFFIYQLTDSFNRRIVSSRSKDSSTPCVKKPFILSIFSIASSNLGLVPCLYAPMAIRS